MNKEEIFERIFGSNHGDESIFDASDRLLSSFIYDVAWEEFFSADETKDSDDEIESNDYNAHSFSMLSFEDKVEATKENFERIVELFQKTSRAKSAFLKNFEMWAPTCDRHIKELRRAADDIHANKYNSDIARLVGSLVGIVGGAALVASFFTPLAAVTITLTVGGGIASGLGAGVVIGTSGTELALLKKKLDEAKETIKEIDKNFFLMSHWFAMPEELRKTLDSLVSYEILKEIGEDFKRFFDEVRRHSNMTIGNFKGKFKEVLKFCMRKMNNSGRISSEFGSVFTPIVITFMFLVCLLKGQNRILLDCILINQRLAFSLIKILDLGVHAGQLFQGLAKGMTECGDEFFKLAFTKFIVGLGIAIDLLNVILNSIDIHKQIEPKQATELKKAAKQLENVFLAIENVYKETKKSEKYANTEKTKWTTIVVKSVPDATGLEDLKLAVRPHLPDTARDFIKLQKLPTKGNEWLIAVPAIHSETLLLQSHLVIREERCVIVAK